MTALTEFLFPAPARRKASAIVGWWERRRLAYNVIVGGSGLVSLGVGFALSWLPPNGWGGSLGFPWQPVVVFGVLANLFYFLGPTVELLIEKLSKGQVLPTGPVLYRMGLTFSAGLALLPTLIFLLDWVFRIVQAVI